MELLGGSMQELEEGEGEMELGSVEFVEVGLGQEVGVGVGQDGKCEDGLLVLLEGSGKVGIHALGELGVSVRLEFEVEDGLVVSGLREGAEEEAIGGFGVLGIGQGSGELGAKKNRGAKGVELGSQVGEEVVAG